MRNIITLLFVIGLLSANAQTKFKLIEEETSTWQSIYTLVDLQNKTIRVLDTNRYYLAMDGFKYGYFAVLGVKGEPGWTAIDANENKLFQVYNTSFGEPSPDYLIENKIRIVGDDDKIGFANEKGEIIIAPQFEIVSSFHNGFAIIGEACEKIPWGIHEHEDDCEHYSIACDRHGYINEKGEIIKLGDYTFEQIRDEIDWKQAEE